MLKTLVRITALLAFVAVIPVASLPGGQRATAAPVLFQVTKIADTADGSCDPGDCSLREAIIAANGFGALTTTGVVSPPNVQVPAGTYTLTIPGVHENESLTGDLDITAAMNIVGAGPNSTIIDGGAQDTVIDIRPEGDLKLSGVTVQNGKDPDTGGIFSDGPLVMDNVHVSLNTGTGTDAEGATGGVTVRYNATITNSLFFKNTATGNSTGGLYGQDSSNITVTNTTFDSNSVDGDFPTGGLGFHGNVTLDRVIVENNTATGNHPLAGLYSDGNATIMNSQFLNNDVTDETGVGAILNRGFMTILDTTVDGNDAGDNDGVGGILSLTPDGGFANLTLRRVTVSNNSAGTTGAGGLWIETPAFLGEVAIDHNSATNEGTGGVEFYAADPVQLSRVAITNNSAGTFASGGAFIDGGSHVTIDDSWIDHNTAVQNSVAGIDVVGDSVLDLNRVGITNNSASELSTGGLSIYQGTATLTNVTVSGNSAVGNATGGLYVDTGTLTINFTTIDNNTAGNSFGVGGLTNYGTIHISNSILGNNPAEVNCYQTAGASTGHNIDQGADCGFVQASDMSNTNPMLLSLADNGGFSPTQAIAPSSPALDAAGACPPPDSDQRIFPRPQGTACDIGAFEAGSLATLDRLWGDTSCFGGAGVDDALAGIAALAGVTQSQPVGGGCPLLNQNVYVGGWFVSHLWGDWSCDGLTDMFDALLILRSVAEVPLTPEEPCPAIGDAVPIS